MQALPEKSKQDSLPQTIDYNHELCLQLLQANQDEQAQEEFRLLSAKFSRWPFKLFQSWLILSLVSALGTECFLLHESLWQFIIGKVDPLRIGYSLVTLLATIGHLPFIFGCVQMLNAIKKKKSKSAQEGLRKFQYGIIIFIIELSFTIWIVGFKDFFSSPYGWLAFAALAIIPGGQLVGGFAVMRAFKEGEKVAREDTCDASQVSEETSPLIRDFLKQNEVLQEEVSKYDEQLNRFGVKVYRCWLKLTIIFEIVRILTYPMYALPLKDGDAWIKSVTIGLFVSSFSCLYSCFKMEHAIAKKFVRSSERAVMGLKVCAAVSVISCLFILKVFNRDHQDGLLEKLVPLNLWLFAYCTFVTVVTLLGAIKVHKVIKHRDDYAKFSSINNVSSNL